jgi:hypothetical protein
MQTVVGMAVVMQSFEKLQEDHPKHKFQVRPRLCPSARGQEPIVLVLCKGASVEGAWGYVCG